MPEYRQCATEGCPMQTSEHNVRDASLPWYCEDHRSRGRGDLAPDLEAQMARGPHPQTVLPCARAGCTRQHSFDIADQIPAQWFCEAHRDAPKPTLSIQQEANIFQAADAWVQDIKRECVTLNTFNARRATEIVERAMTGAVREVASENNLLHMEKSDCLKDIKKLRLALEQFNPFLKAMGEGDTVEMARTLGIINAVRDEYPL